MPIWKARTMLVCLRSSASRASRWKRPRSIESLALDGGFSNVVGLPLERLEALLNEMVTLR